MQVVGCLLDDDFKQRPRPICEYETINPIIEITETLRNRR